MRGEKSRGGVKADPLVFRELRRGKSEGIKLGTSRATYCLSDLSLISGLCGSPSTHLDLGACRTTPRHHCWGSGLHGAQKHWTIASPAC